VTIPRLSALGDSAITVTIGDGISEALSDRVVSQARRVVVADITGVTDVVPSYASFAVYYEPLTIAYDDLRLRIEGLLSEDVSSSKGRADSKLHRIRVSYDGEDLEEVARLTRLSPADVVRLHSAPEYRVFVIGFVPGFAYLGVLDERLALPRRPAPRTRVPPGSVAIAERQTGVYPTATPGGWHLLGTTDVVMFDVHRDPPTLLQVGDRVKFEAVG